MVTEVTNQEPVLVLNEKKYIISDLSDEAKYFITQINDIQTDINSLTKALDRHQTAYQGFQQKLELAVEPEVGEEDE